MDARHRRLGLEVEGAVRSSPCWPSGNCRYNARTVALMIASEMTRGRPLLSGEQRSACSVFSKHRNAMPRYERLRTRQREVSAGRTGCTDTWRFSIDVVKNGNANSTRPNAGLARCKCVRQSYESSGVAFTSCRGWCGSDWCRLVTGESMFPGSMSRFCERRLAINHETLKTVNLAAPNP